MTTMDIAEIFIAVTGKIDFYWNFYTVTILALIGWLVSTDKVLQLELKVLITVGYIVFVLMNIIGLWGSYTFAEALRQDLLISVKTIPDTLRNTQVVLSDRSFLNQRVLALVIHSFLGVIVLGVVWFGRLRKSVSDDHK